MEFHSDFEDLCSLLNAKNVEFLIVGGYAVAFHGAPRFTGDMDILVRPDAANVERLLDVLPEFGFATRGLEISDILRQRRILQLGRIPVQIHIMTGISGVSWETAWETKVEGKYGETEVFFLGRQSLILNKRAAGRAKDLADIQALEG